MDDRAARKAAFLEQMRLKREQSSSVSSQKPAVLQDVKVYKPVVKVQMPKDLVEGVGDFLGIDEFIAQLPENYNFEVKKSVWRILESKARVVALQLPEGLLMYACLLSDIFDRYAHAHAVILGDVTYGACCVDDYTARALGADLLIHYGHSCLVNVADTCIGVQYVFVDIRFDVTHLVETVKFNFTPQQHLAVVGTIQFASSFHEAKRQLETHFTHLHIPQAKPLSAGELLGCTSPTLPSDTDAVIYVADGRFHLESLMIANPKVPCYRYEPHGKKFTREYYDHERMMQTRREAVEKGREARLVGVILGTLGRQGNVPLMERVKQCAERAGKEVVVVMLSEITGPRLQQMSQVDCWVQIACPRLSVDWGYSFEKPLLNAYEAMVSFGAAEWKSIYPQDYYAKEGGPWTNYYNK